MKNPWEIFAYLPFGGWNECPNTPELMAVAKYWAQQHGAVPAAMSHDELEFTLPAPVPEGESHGDGGGAVRLLPGRCGSGGRPNGGQSGLTCYGSPPSGTSGGIDSFTTYVLPREGSAKADPSQPDKKPGSRIKHGPGFLSGRDLLIMFYRTLLGD